MTQRHSLPVAQLELYDDRGRVNYRKVAAVTLPGSFRLPDGTAWTPCEDPGEQAQSEAMVVDAASRYLYVAQEDIGIWRVPVPFGRGRPVLVDRTTSFGVPATFDEATEECVPSGGRPRLRRRAHHRRRRGPRDRAAARRHRCPWPPARATTRSSATTATARDTAAGSPSSTARSTGRATATAWPSCRCRWARGTRAGSLSSRTATTPRPGEQQLQARPVAVDRAGPAPLDGSPHRRHAGGTAVAHRRHAAGTGGRAPPSRPGSARGANLQGLVIPTGGHQHVPHTQQTQYNCTPDKPDPLYAMKLQEILGGAYGEMTVAMQYLFQGWNTRLPGKYKDLILDTATEELGHVEMICIMIARLLEGAPAEQTLRRRGRQPGARRGPRRAEPAARDRRRRRRGGGRQRRLPVERQVHHRQRQPAWPTSTPTRRPRCRAACRSARLYNMTDDHGVRDMLRFNLARDTCHQNQWLAAIEQLQADGLEDMPVPIKFGLDEEYTEHSYEVWGLSDGTVVGGRSLGGRAERRRPGRVHLPRPARAAGPASGRPGGRPAALRHDR